MKILLIAERWGSFSGIGSLRPMKMAKYLIRRGHQVLVVCGESVKDPNNFDPELEKLRQEPLYTEMPLFGNSGLVDLEKRIRTRFLEWRRGKKQKAALATSTDRPIIPSSGIIKQCLLFIDNKLYNPLKELNSSRVALSLLKGNDVPDVIISSYEPLRVPLLGKYLKQKYPDSIWLSDFRDPIPKAWDIKPIKAINRHIQKWLCSTADIVTIVSSTWKQALQADGILNVHMLSSGYDLEDYLNVESKNKSDGDMIKFTYTGNLYPGQYDLSPLVACLVRLLEESEKYQGKFQLEYAGSHGIEFNRQAFSLRDKVTLINHGLIPRKDAIQMQVDSDILLHAAYNTQQFQGLMTGKIYEYIASKKPIIAFIKGNGPDSELGQMLKKARVGLVYEENNFRRDAELDAYIKMQYKHKKRYGYFYQDRDESFLSTFNYENIVDELLSLIENRKITN